jgi:flagellar basal body-associated protein FliL
MKKKKVFKTIGLILLSGTLVLVSTSTIFLTLKPNSKQEINNFPIEKNVAPELYQERILNNSYLTSTEKKYFYDGITFSSENDLNEYIYTKGNVQSHVTSVDPIKIVTDYNE